MDDVRLIIMMNILCWWSRADGFHVDGWRFQAKIGNTGIFDVLEGVQTGRLIGLSFGDERLDPSDTADLTADPTDMILVLDANALDSAHTITPDASTDAGDPPYVPDIAEEQPTDGNADLPGAMGLTMPVAVGLSRAGRVQEESEKLTGPEELSHRRFPDG